MKQICARRTAKKAKEKRQLAKSKQQRLKENEPAKGSNEASSEGGKRHEISVGKWRRRGVKSVIRVKKYYRQQPAGASAGGIAKLG